MNKFITDVTDVDLLNLFIMGLRADDTRRSLYSDAYTELDQTKIIDDNDRSRLKIDTICKLIRDAIEKLSFDEQLRRFTTILSTFIKCTKPQVDIALQTLKNFATKSKFMQILL